MEIKNISLRHLSNEEQFRFLSYFTALFAEFREIGFKIFRLLGYLYKLYAFEDEIMNLMREDEHFTKIADADHQLSIAIYNFRYIIHNMESNSDSAIADAALSIKFLLNNLGVCIYYTNNSMEDAIAVNKMLKKLDSPEYTPKIELIAGLDEQIKKIRIACNKIRALIKSSPVNEIYDDHNNRIENVRCRIESIYYDIIARIKMIDGEEEYDSFVRKLNALIDEFGEFGKFGDITQTDMAIEKEREKISIDVPDSEILRTYDMIEMTIMDYNSGRRKEIEKGII